MEKLISRLCFGGEDDNNEPQDDQQDNTNGHNNTTDLVCYVDQFLLGVTNSRVWLYTVDIDVARDTSAPTAKFLLLVVVAMVPTLEGLSIPHQQGSNVSIIVGEGSIEKALLSQKSLLINDRSAAKSSGKIC
jgi:hypothetical protein